MALPKVPLKLELPDVEALTIDEAEMFSEGDKFRFSVFKKFLADHSNWTEKQVGALTLGEMKAITPLIAAEFNKAAAPKASLPG